MPSARQLAAIMFTDIVGYTALMGKDELRAFEILRQNRQLQRPLIEQHGGKWIKELGDGVLASFTTVSDAVQAAISIQETCKQANDFALRIGIHEGEVIFEQDDVFGDAVNIASRIQALAPAGGIWVSEAVHHNLYNKQGYKTRFVKEVRLKNVQEPVRIYEVEAGPAALPQPSARGASRFPTHPGKRSWSISRPVVMALVLLVLAAAGYLIYTGVVKQEANTYGTTGREKSIAVLPFVNMSNDKDQEYFSDGLSEELLNLLAKIPELKVTGRTSSFSFKGKNEDLRAIAQKLGVAHLLEGSVRKDGDRIRVSARLIRASDGSRIWSNSYDKEMEDIFRLQDEIAEAVVEQLKLQLLPDAAGSIASPMNTEAYNLILQGNYFLEKRDEENLAKAFAYYQQALAIDSLSARAWTSLAKCLNLQAQWGGIERNEGFRKAREAATRALVLDNKQVDAYRVLGEVKMYHFDWSGAEAEYRKAHQLEPGNADVSRIIGYLYRCVGRFEEAVPWARQSIALDPLKAIAYFNYGQLLYYAGHSEEAVAAYRKVLDLNPQFPRTHVFLGKVYILQGKPQLALAEMQQERDKAWQAFGTALAYHALGHKQKAGELLNDLIASFPEGESYQVAELYAFHGDKDKALEWLEKAYAHREVRLTYLKGDPLLRILEGDKRYIAMLKKLNLPLE